MNLPFNYTLKRSARKTLSVSIQEGKVVVLAPQRLQESYIFSFLQQKQTWIQQKVQLYEQQNNRFLQYIHYNKFLYLGKSIPLQFAGRNGMQISEEGITLPLKYSHDLPKDLLFRFKKAYREKAKEVLHKRLQAVSAYTKIVFQNFQLTDAKSKWGSCSKEGNIMLNWRLVFLPTHLIDYVALHELCHIIHLNHAKEFWKSVALFMPKYKKCVYELKDCAVLMGLFRGV